MRTSGIAAKLAFVTLLSWRSDAADRPVSGENKPSVRKETILLSTYDFAKVGLKTVSRAANIVAGILALSSLSVGWETGDLAEGRQVGTDFSARNAEPCASPLPPARVLIQLQPHAPIGFAQEALGYALPCARFGIQVTIYVDRVERVSDSTLAAFYRVLGHAMAHEVGHALQGVVRTRRQRFDERNVEQD